MAELLPTLAPEDDTVVTPSTGEQIRSDDCSMLNRSPHFRDSKSTGSRPTMSYLWSVTIEESHTSVSHGVPVDSGE